MTDKSEKSSLISAIEPGMTVLDIVSTYSAAQEVFKRWDDRAGECICCNALFESLDAVAEKYNLDLAALVQDLQNAARNSRAST
ncbi:MAG: hypothetical protein AB7U43_13230 [Desulfobacter sp.]